jgi:Cys-tRNA(Pro) deacylase
VRAWPEAVERVGAHFVAAGAEGRIEELEADCASAQAAADALGCTLGQIVKSLVLMADGRPAIALVPGDSRADTRKIAAALGAKHSRIARPDEVVTATGYEPGAVAPFALARVRRILMEATLLGFESVWCGAGSKHHMASLSPTELLRVSQGVTADLLP